MATCLIMSSDSNSVNAINLKTQFIEWDPEREEQSNLVNVGNVSKMNDISAN